MEHNGARVHLPVATRRDLCAVRSRTHDRRTRIHLLDPDRWWRTDARRTRHGRGRLAVPHRRWNLSVDAPPCWASNGMAHRVGLRLGHARDNRLGGAIRHGLPRHRSWCDRGFVRTHPDPCNQPPRGRIAHQPRWNQNACAYRDHRSRCRAHRCRRTGPVPAPVRTSERFQHLHRRVCVG